MTFASSVCPPHSSTAFSIGFMDRIKPRVECEINRRLNFCEKKTARFNSRFVENPDRKNYAFQMSEDPGLLIKRAIKALGKSQGWLAGEMKVSDNAVSKWVLGGGRVAKEHIPKLCGLLSLDPSIFLGEQLDPSKKPEELAEPPSAPEETNPEEQAEQIIEAVRAILRIAKLPEDCLGAPDSLRAALASKEPLERYSLAEIEATLRELHQDKPAAFRNAHPDELFGALAGNLRNKGHEAPEAEKQASNVHPLPTKG